MIFTNYCYTITMKALLTSPTRQFIMNVVIVLVASLILWLTYLLRDFIGLFLISCFFGLLLGPFVVKLRKW